MAVPNDATSGAPTYLRAVRPRPLSGHPFYGATTSLMALQPLSQIKALVVILNALIGVTALAVVAFVETANETVRGWLAEVDIPFGLVMLIATASVTFWTAFGFWSLSKDRAAAP